MTRPALDYPVAYGALAEALVTRYPMTARDLAEIFEGRVSSPLPDTGPAVIEAWRAIAYDLRQGLAFYDTNNATPTPTTKR